MSEHVKHFIPDSDGAPIFTPEPGCLECAEQMALDRSAADMAHRDDLARTVAHLWDAQRADGGWVIASDLRAALDRLAAVHGATT